MKRRFIRPTLRIRIVAWSFIPTAFILLAIALLILYAYQRIAEDLVVKTNEELTRRAAGQLSSSLGSYVNSLDVLARTVDIYSDNAAQQTAAIREAGNRLVMFDGGLVVLNNVGQVVAAVPERQAWVGQHWSSFRFFQQMLHTSGPTFSDILPRSPQTVAVAVPILDDQGNFRGALLGLFQMGARSVSAFYGDIVKLRIGGTGSTYLVDSTGQLIYHSNDTLIGSDLSGLPVVQQVLHTQTGYLRSHDSAGRDILSSFSSVPGTPWGLVSEQSWSELLTASQGYGQFLLVLLALGLIVPTLVVGFGVKRITDPIRQLNEAARAIAGGCFGQEIAVHTGDELEDLATQFNLMSQQLSGLYSNLEQRVEARTKELTMLHDIASVVSQSLNLKEILSAALNRAIEAMHMEAGTAYYIPYGDGPEEDKSLIPVAQQGLSPEFARCIGSPAVRGSIVQRAAVAQRPMMWLIGDHPEPHVKQALESEGIRQIISVPLFAKGELVGAFNLATRNERDFAASELTLLASIGQQVAVAVENARLYDQAEQSAAIAERHRLSRELHDSVTQSLYGVSMYAEAAARLLTSGDYVTAAEHLRELRDTAQEALREMRLLIFELRPLALERMGLVAALRARLDSVEIRGGVQAELQAEDVQRAEQLPYPVQLEFYHIAQEALNNALKHANAQHIVVSLKWLDKTLCMEIRDDGVGFIPENVAGKGGLGLSGMSERVQRIGGMLQIESKPGEGTTLKVNIPIINNLEDSPDGRQHIERMKP